MPTWFAVGGRSALLEQQQELGVGAGGRRQLSVRFRVASSRDVTNRLAARETSQGSRADAGLQCSFGFRLSLPISVRQLAYHFSLQVFHLQLERPIGQVSRVG